MCVLCALHFVLKVLTSVDDNGFFRASASFNGWDNDDVYVFSPKAADNTATCRNGRVPSREFSNGRSSRVTGKPPPSATVTSMDGNSCPYGSCVFDAKADRMAHCGTTDVIGGSVGRMADSLDVNDETTMTNGSKSFRCFDSVIVPSRHGFRLSGDVGRCSDESRSACATLPSFDTGDGFHPVGDDAVLFAGPTVTASATDSESSSDVKFCMSGWSYDIDPNDASIFEILNI
jgi:hypothetical protein